MTNAMKKADQAWQMPFGDHYKIEPVKVYAEDNDDSYTIVWYVDAPMKTVKRIIAEDYPIEHCQHEYDCCGHWYNRYVNTRQVGSLVRIELSRYCNI